MSYESINVDEHIKLAQLQPDQADRLFELTDTNREYFQEYLPWVSQVKTVEDSKKHIEETLENRTNGTSYTYAIVYDNNVVGDISLRNLKESAQPAEIGYWMDKEYSGKGLTTRAVQALTNFGIETLGLERIKIRVNPNNTGSNKVAEKSGYTLIGSEADDEDGEVLNVWTIDK